VAQIKCTDRSGQATPFKASAPGIGRAARSVGEIPLFFIVVQKLTAFFVAGFRVEESPSKADNSRSCSG
jgi:hypothetical protein